MSENGIPSRVVAALTAESVILEHAQALTLRLVDRALRGDPAALKMCLDRLLPATKTRATPFAMRPGPITGESIAAAYADLTRQLARGEATPDEVREVFAALEAMRAAVVTAELEKDVEALKAGRDPEPRVEAVVPPGPLWRNPFVEGDGDG